MKRSDYLELCVRAARSKAKPVVLYEGIEYHPEQMQGVQTVFKPLMRPEKLT